MNYLYYLFLILPIALIISLLKFRQSLAPGLLLILNIINIGLLILHLYHQNLSFIQNNDTIKYLAIFLYVGLILSLIIFPALLIINFLYNGVVIIKREGFSPKNLLSILFPVFVVTYALLWRNFGSDLYNSIEAILYNYLGMTIIYFLIISTAYFFSSAFNMLHPRPKNINYVIVLGSGLMGDQVTPLLKGRIDKGIEVYRKNPNSKIVMSGGQGKDELIPEALAMYKYAISRGVPDTDMIIESNSKNTKENLIFSMRQINDKKGKIAIVSSNYHIFRALIIANELGIKAIGYGKSTKRYFAINAFMREIISYIYLERKKHLLIFSILSVVFLFLVIGLIIVKTNGITI